MSFSIYKLISASISNVQIPIDANEFLQVAPGVNIFMDGASIAITNQTTGGNSEVDIQGNVAGGFGVYFYLNDINNTVSVGPGAKITAGVNGVDFQGGNFSVGTNHHVLNAGYIYGADHAIHFTGSLNFVENAGVLQGKVAIDGQGFGDRIVNASGGVIQGFDHAIEALLGELQLSNAGVIESYSNAVSLGNANLGPVLIENSGTISAVADDAITGFGDNVKIFNSGKISSSGNAINLSGTGAGLETIVNQMGGLIEGLGSYAINLAQTPTRLLNAGEIAGAVQLFSNSTVANTGSITGDVHISGAGAIVRNSGHITGQSVAISIDGAASIDDRIVNTATGVIDATGANAITHGANGTLRVVNRGEIFGDLALSGQATMVNIGSETGGVTFGLGASLVVNRGLIDGSVVFAGLGNIYRGQAGAITGVVNGAGVDGRYLGGAGDDAFNLSASGAKFVSGGAGDDTFSFTVAGLNAKTVVKGGDGVDTLAFTTPGALSTSTFAHVSGIESINLAAGANSLKLTDALVSSALGGAITVNGGNGLDTINVSAVTTASDTVTIVGGASSDVLTAGGATDIFGYNLVSESTGPTYDKIAGLNFSIDRFDVSAAAGSILAIDLPATGSLSTATFNVDLAAGLPAAKLAAHDAALFTASAGTLSGQTFLVIDANGVAGYQANLDLVMNLTGATGTLTTANFI